MPKSNDPGSTSNQSPNSDFANYEIKEDLKFTLDELKEVWYYGMFNGATLWQVIQNNKNNAMSSKGMSDGEAFQELTKQLHEAVQSSQSIKDLAGNQSMLLGVACELLGITELK